MKRPVVPIAAMMLLTVACTTRQTIDPPAPGQPSTTLKGEVRVVRTDGAAYVLHDTRIQSDSVIGTNAAGARIAIATNEVSTIDERRLSGVRTAGLIGGTALAIGAVLVISTAIMLAGMF